MHIYIIGSGPAGVNAAQAARKENEDAKVTVLSNDTHLPYFRLRLFDVIEDPSSKEKLILHPMSWYQDQGIDLQLNTTVKAIHPEDHEIELDDGTKLAYDRLIIATGSKSFVPPIKGSEHKDVHTLWTMDEAITIGEKLDGKDKAVVIGGGLLGLEAGHAMVKKGLDVTIIEVLPRLMTRQLDDQAAALFKKHMENKGVHIITAATTEEIVADETGQLKEVRLASGETFPADIVFISAGVRAVLDPVQDSGIQIDRCIVVNDRMETNIKDVYAAGDNVLFDNRWYGLWQIAIAQGRIAGANAAGSNVSYTMPVPPYVMNMMGTRISSSGVIDNQHDVPAYHEEIKMDDDACTYEKLVFSGDRLIGFVLLGDTKRQNELQKRML